MTQASAMLDNTGNRLTRDLRIGLIVVAGLFVIAAAVGLMEVYVPRLRSFTGPRFGGCLITCIFPVIFLASSIRSPIVSNLVAAGGMTTAIGIVNAVSLCRVGTVTIIQNDFTQRLHSSWLWAVFPFFIVGGYILWSAVNSSPTVRIQNGEDGV